MNNRTIPSSAESLHRPAAARPPLLRKVPDQTVAHEEALVIDARAGLTPAEVVELKLSSLLKDRPLPVSQLLNACRNRKPS